MRKKLISELRLIAKTIQMSEKRHVRGREKLTTNVRTHTESKRTKKAKM